MTYSPPNRKAMIAQAQSSFRFQDRSPAIMLFLLLPPNIGSYIDFFSALRALSPFAVGDLDAPEILFTLSGF